MSESLPLDVDELLTHATWVRRLALVIGTAPGRSEATPSTAQIAGTAALTGGALMGKKVLVAATVLLLLSVGAYVTATRSQAPTSRSEPNEETAAASLAPHVRSERKAEPAADALVGTTREVPARSLIRGRVVDAEGRPVPGATVVAVPEFPGMRALPAGRGTSAHTAADGAFAIATADVSPSYCLFGDAARHGPVMREHARPGDEVTIVLAASESMTGRVRDMERRPISGARVTWTTSTGYGTASACRSARHHGSTDLDAAGRRFNPPRSHSPRIDLVARRRVD